MCQRFAFPGQLPNRVAQGPVSCRRRRRRMAHCRERYPGNAGYYSQMDTSFKGLLKENIFIPRWFAFVKCEVILQTHFFIKHAVYLNK